MFAHEEKTATNTEETMHTKTCLLAIVMGFLTSSVLAADEIGTVSEPLKTRHDAPADIGMTPEPLKTRHDAPAGG